ncbi:MAG: thiopeptide-type bacteriocin biosynthesis protein [Pseudonocardiaceae bacterium]
MRKAPCWRLRMKPGDNASCAEMQTSVNSILDGLTSAGLISRWRQTLYEPETVAFGGRPGIDIAHDLFCSDTSNFLAYLRQPEPPIGRRELSVLFGAHGPLTFAAPWAAAFNHAGQALAAATEGALERGTRDTLAHHVIFHWNRMGLPSDV